MPTNRHATTGTCEIGQRVDRVTCPRPQGLFAGFPRLFGPPAGTACHSGSVNRFRRTERKAEPCSRPGVSLPALYLSEPPFMTTLSRRSMLHVLLAAGATPALAQSAPAPAPN